MTTPSCAYCGVSQSSSGDFVEYTGKDPITLNMEINKLDAQIKRLNEQRSRLLRQLNMLQSPLGILPPEVIALIFQHTCPDVDFTNRTLCQPLGEAIIFLRDRRCARSLDSPISLGSVSSYWRQIAHSTPKLWDSTILTVLPHNIQEKEALLRLYLKNSGILPFSLELDFRWIDSIFNAAANINQSNWGGTGPSLERIRQLVMEEFPEKISVLWIDCPPSEWLINVPHTFIRLRRLGVGWLRSNTFPFRNSIPRGDISLSNVPSVRELKLTRVGPSVELCWINIVKIELSYVPTDISVEVLLRCPNLVEFRSRYAEESWGHRTLQVPNTVILEYLQTFEWSSTSDEWNNLMLQRLHIPALQNLTWSGLCDQGLFPHHFKGFFGRISALKVLELSHYANMGEDMVEDMICDMDHLHTLVLQMCDNQFVERILDVIGPEHKRKNRSPFLPSLKFLRLQGSEFHHLSFGVLNGPMFEGFLNLLPVRKELFPSIPLHLDFNPAIKWSEEVKDVLRDLRGSEGYNFEICHNSEPVDWLDEENEDDVDWLKESDDETGK